MWCPSCRADVAAELSMDNRRLLCARCQSELGIAAGVSPAPSASQRTVEMERDARDLLARWSAESLLAAPAPVAPAAVVPKSTSMSDAPATRSEVRFDRPQMPAPSAAFLAAMKTAPIAFPMERAEAISVPREIPTPKGQQIRIEETPSAEVKVSSSLPAQSHAAEDLHTAGHHRLEREFSAQDYVMPHVPVRPHWTTMLGQLCAYSGIGLLTCGSVLAMWSYFGGPPNYMATGWIAAAFGQMLLLLGIVTLIANGLDQTIKEVAWRIDHLAEEVHHMGLALDDLEDTQRQAIQLRSLQSYAATDTNATREAA